MTVYDSVGHHGVLAVIGLGLDENTTDLARDLRCGTEKSAEYELRPMEKSDVKSLIECLREKGEKYCYPDYPHINEDYRHHVNWEGELYDILQEALDSGATVYTLFKTGKKIGDLVVYAMKDNNGEVTVRHLSEACETFNNGTIRQETFVNALGHLFVINGSVVEEINTNLWSKSFYTTKGTRKSQLITNETLALAKEDFNTLYKYLIQELEKR